MLRVITVSIVLAACSSQAEPDPATCPEEPFESCGFRDGGWDAFCDGDIVYIKSLNTQWYCAPDSSEVVCEVGDPTPHEVHACATSCKANEADRYDYLETFDEYSRFDPATLCE